MAKPNIWIVDTSIFCNILDVPGKNQSREEIIEVFKKGILDGDKFFLPYVVLVETGNHIAQLNGNLKFTIAKEFVTMVEKAINGLLPFTALKFPKKNELLQWITEFPEKSGAGIGFGDCSIIKDWEGQVKLNRGYSVRIWSLDDALQGYES